jgi:predicted DNA-binding transcriptional regulator AlpA
VRDVDQLAGVAEVAQLLGVSRQQVHRLAAREDFPTPVAVLASGRIWLLRDVERWGREHAGRRPGRPETRPPGR